MMSMANTVTNVPRKNRASRLQLPLYTSEPATVATVVIQKTQMNGLNTFIMNPLAMYTYHL